MICGIHGKQREMTVFMANRKKWRYSWQTERNGGIHGKQKEIAVFVANRKKWRYSWQTERNGGIHGKQKEMAVSWQTGNNCWQTNST